MTPLRFETEDEWIKFENTGRRPLSLTFAGCKFTHGEWKWRIVAVLALALLATPALAATAEPAPDPVQEAATKVVFPKSVWVDFHWPNEPYRGGGIDQDNENPLLYRMLCQNARHPAVIRECRAQARTVTVGGGGEVTTPTPIPLPASLTLLLGAMGGLGLIGRRKA